MAEVLERSESLQPIGQGVQIPLQGAKATNWLNVPAPRYGHEMKFGSPTSIPAALKFPCSSAATRFACLWLVFLGYDLSFAIRCPKLLV